jgi:phospholipase A-2-activating protein
VIIWKEFQKAIKIEGHKQAVWAVKFIGEDRLLTGRWSYSLCDRAES